MPVIGVFWNKQEPNSPHKDRIFYRDGVAGHFSNTDQMWHLDVESKAVCQPAKLRFTGSSLELFHTNLRIKCAAAIDTDVILV
jgi:hypothetical protein